MDQHHWHPVTEHAAYQMYILRMEWSTILGSEMLGKQPIMRTA